MGLKEDGEREGSSIPCRKGPFSVKAIGPDKSINTILIYIQA